MRHLTILIIKCESASRRFQPEEGPSRGLLRDCTTSPINCLQHYLEVVSTDAVGEVVAVVDVTEVGEPDGVLDEDGVLL